MIIQYYAFLFVSFFPFISLYNFGTDIQPYALFLSLVIFAQNFLLRFRINKKLFPLAFGAIFSVLILVVNGMVTFTEVRSAVNYVSLFFISSATLFTLNKLKGLNEKYVKLIINLWFAVGAIQLIFDRDFLNFLIPGARTSASRGVIGLASEPSFYGYTIIFMMLFVLDFKKDKFLYLLNLITQLFLFSQSAVSIVYLFLYLSIYLLVNMFKFNFKKYKTIIISILLVSVATFVAFSIYPDNRATVIVKNLVKDPIQFSQSDKSISVRVESVINPLKVSFSDFLLPHGYFNTLNDVGYSRIMSGYGATLYELGFVGLYLMISIFLIIKKSTYHTNNNVNAIFITIIMFSAIQIASPIFAFYLGYCIYKSQRISGNRYVNTKK